MRIIAQGRGAGKTYRLVQWVLKGEPIQHYPFWSRIIIVSHHQMIYYLLKMYPALSKYQVVDRHEWAKLHVAAGDVEIAVDDAEELLRQVLGTRPSIVTMTGAVWNAEL